MSDHYQVLGVERGSTQEIISAAYRALAKAFHPDVFRGDRDYAESRLKAINAAFDVIGDPARRSAYDRDTGIRGGLDPKADDDWTRACQFFPELSGMGKDLDGINAQLGATFRKILLGSKAFKDAKGTRDRLIDEFATEKFGRNDQLQAAGLTSLRMGRRKLALSINQACRVIGDDDPAVILTRLAQENYEDARPVYLASRLGHFLPLKDMPPIHPGLYKIKDRFRFRVLPDASITIFYENGRELEDYKHLPNLKSFLASCQASHSEIESMEGDNQESR